MGFVSDVGSTFERFMNKHGSVVSIQLKTRSYTGSSYDDEILTASGTVVNSYHGWIQNISANPHGDDFAYVQQGLLKLGDQKMYIPSNCPIAENADVVINGGSYWALKYITWEISGTNAYTTVYLRPTASLEIITYG